MAAPSTNSIRAQVMRIIDTWPREWRELVHEYGYMEVMIYRAGKTSAHDARALLAARRRRIEELTR